MFPREIVDLFVNELTAQRTDITPLLSVSRVFNASARHVIFGTITLIVNISDQNDGKLFLLLEVIRGDPHVLNSIRTLGVGFRGGTHDLLRNSEILATQSLHTLLRILSTAPAIKNLTINGRWGFFNMALLPKETVNHLLAIRSIPSLRSITFHNLSNFIPDFVTGIGPRGEDKITSLVMGGAVHPAPILTVKSTENTMSLGPSNTRSNDPCVGTEGGDRILPALTSFKLGGPSHFLRLLCCQPASQIPHIRFPLLNYFSATLASEPKSNEVATVTKFIQEAPLLTSLEISNAVATKTVKSIIFDPLYDAIRQARTLSNLTLLLAGRLSPTNKFLAKLGPLPGLKSIKLGAKTRLQVDEMEKDQEIYERFEVNLKEMRRVLQKITSRGEVEFELSLVLGDSFTVPYRIHVFERYRGMLDQFKITDDIYFSYRVFEPTVEL